MNLWLTKISQPTNVFFSRFMNMLWVNLENDEFRIKMRIICRWFSPFQCVSWLEKEIYILTCILLKLQFYEKMLNENLYRRLMSMHISKRTKWINRNLHFLKRLDIFINFYYIKEMSIQFSFSKISKIMKMKIPLKSLNIGSNFNATIIWCKLTNIITSYLNPTLLP